MSTTYPEFPNTEFPLNVDTFARKSDLTAEVLSAYLQYQIAVESGNLSLANSIWNSNPALKNCTINAEDFNNLSDAIKALEQHYLFDIQTWIFNVAKSAGEWSSTKKYTKFTYVSHTVGSSTQTYMCVDLNTPIGTLPTDTNYWIRITMRGEKGDPGIGLIWKGAWNSTTQYVLSDMVAHSNALWGSNTTNTNKTPSSSSTDWIKIIEFSTSMLTYDNSISGLTATSINGAIDELALKVTPINRGGTGANTLALAKENLGINNVNNTADSAKNVNSATKLTNPKTIAVSGGATGTATSFDGSSNISIPITALNPDNLSKATPISKGGTGATTAGGALTNLGFTATVAEINIMDGITATTSELNYCDGVTSNIQTQLNTKAPTSSPTFTNAKGAADTNYATALFRNIQLTSTDPGEGTASSLPNGSIVMVYE